MTTSIVSWTSRVQLKRKKATSTVHTTQSPRKWAKEVPPPSKGRWPTTWQSYYYMRQTRCIFLMCPHFTLCVFTLLYEFPHTTLYGARTPWTSSARSASRTTASALVSCATRVSSMSAPRAWSRYKKKISTETETSTVSLAPSCYYTFVLIVPLCYYTCVLIAPSCYYTCVLILPYHHYISTTYLARS